MCHYYHFVINWCYNHGQSKTAQSPVNTIVSFSWHNRLPWQHYNLLKIPLSSALSAYISKTARWNVFLLSNFDKQDKMQLLATFKKILYMGFRATLKFRKLRWLWTFTCIIQYLRVYYKHIMRKAPVSLIEHCTGIAEVMGSNPVQGPVSQKPRKLFGPVKP